MSWSQTVLTLTGLCLLACATRPPAPSAGEPSTAATRASARVERPSRNAAADQPIESMVAEMARASDVRNFAVRLEQHAPPELVPLQRRNAGLPAAFTRVVAYVMNFDRGSKQHLGSDTPECGGAVAQDGTLCPSVVVPGVQLSPLQVATLQQLAREIPPVPRVSSCASRPNHSFVFYGANGAPVFEWVVNLRCGSGSLSSWVLSEATRRGMAALCRELALGLCFLGDSAKREAAEQAFAARYIEQLPGGSRRLRPFPIRVSPERDLRSLTPAERRELCAWNIQHTTNGLSPGAEPRSVEGGARSRLLGMNECVTSFPNCSRALSETLPCMTEAQRGAPVFFRFSDPNCSTLRSCLWGFELQGPSLVPEGRGPVSPLAPPPP